MNTQETEQILNEQIKSHGPWLMETEEQGQSHTFKLSTTMGVSMCTQLAWIDLLLTNLATVIQGMELTPSDKEIVQIGIC